MFRSSFAGAARRLRVLPFMAASLAFAASAQAASRYHIVDAGYISGGYGNALNDSGQITGTVIDNFTESSFINTNGSIDVIHDLNSYGSSAFAINNKSEIVGWTNSIFGQFQQSVYTSTGAYVPNIPENSYGNGINDSDQITGSFYVSGTVATSHAYLYSRNGAADWANGDFKDLGSLGGPNTSSYGQAINQSGVVTGSSQTSDGSRHAFIYRNGVMTDLGQLHNDRYATGVAINDSGVVAGSSGTPGAQSSTFIYKDGVMTELGGILQSVSSGAVGINNAGDVVGNYSLSSADPNHSFLYSNGQVTDLNDLVDPNSQWTLNDVFGINNHGWIGGNGIDTSTGQMHMLLLKPNAVPETSPLSVLLIGAALLVFAVKKSAYSARDK